MFERYTEKARRAIFFSRYETSRLGGSYIQTEHLLLGIAREDATLQHKLRDVELLRREIEARSPALEKLPKAVDLPLSQESKRALSYAAEEAEDMQHRYIDCGHLVLGLIRVKDSLAANLLRDQGIAYEEYRELVHKAVPTLPGPSEEISWKVIAVPAPIPEESTSLLQSSITALRNLLDHAREHLDINSPDYGRHRLKRKPWSRQEALGHLVDLASAHHHWVARALTEPRLTALSYPSDDWVTAQGYAHFPWPDLVELWLAQNRLLLHDLTRIPEEKVHMSCRIGIEDPIPLSILVERYVEHCEDVLEQVLSRL